MFSIENIKNDVKDKLKGKYLNYFIIMIIIFLASNLTNIFSFFIDDNLSFKYGCFVVDMIIYSFISVYIYNLDLNIAKSKENYLPDMHKVFFKTFKSILILLMIGVAVYVGLCLLVVPGIYIMIIFSQSYYILVDDEDKDSTDCLEESMILMKGNVLNYILLQISFIPYILLSIITCGIYLFWAIPKIQVAKANFYLHLKENNEILI